MSSKRILSKPLMWLLALASPSAVGCRGAVLELGDAPATCVDASCAEAEAEAESGSYALVYIESDDYTRAGESAPRQSYAFLGDVTSRADATALRHGCLGAFEASSSGTCVACTEDEVARTGTAPVGSDVLLHSVTATGGELPSMLTLRWDGAPAGPTPSTVSSTARGWGDGPDVRLSSSFFRRDPIVDPAGGDLVLEANATLAPPRYLVLASSSTAPGATVSREDDLVVAWTPREGAARPEERVRMTLETKDADRFDAEHRSTGRVRRVSCEFASSSGGGVIPSEVLRQMAPGEKVASMTSLNAAEVIGPVHPEVHIPWLVRYELRSVVRTLAGDAFDAITLE